MREQGAEVPGIGLDGYETLKDLFGKDFQIITLLAVTVNEIEDSNVLKSFR